LKIDINFFVPGEPKSKGRHRSRIAKTGTGKSFVQTYAPKETVDYENRVRMQAHEAMEGAAPTRFPVSVVIHAHLSVPTSWSKKKQAAAMDDRVMPTGKPDMDNLLKAVLDGMNRIVFHDDAQVCKISMLKVYGRLPGVEVFVSEISADPAR
jgi:Holliday junction resolvase RusA-like endonuclease